MKYFFLVLVLLLVGREKETIKTQKPLHVKASQETLYVKIQNIENELKRIKTISYLENYISNIIINGSSNNLGFPAGNMQGGFAYKSDAKDIARFVVTLSHQKSSDDKRAKKAEIFFSSNCGGCHGQRGKGLHGSFPNLTRKPLLGIEKRKKALLVQLNSLQSQNTLE